MTHARITGSFLFTFMAVLFLAHPTHAASKTDKEAIDTIALFKKTDPGMSKFFEESVGYVVFPKITKAAIGIGGAHGKGIVYENKKKVGKASLSQGTIGFQLGGQIYAEVIFFETETTLENFKQSTMKLSAQVSAVAAAEGVSENAKYEHGVAVFTIARTGLMFEASVGGQKFKYQPGK